MKIKPFFALLTALVLATPAIAQVTESKDNDPQPTAGFAPLATGGPDTFGYTFSDSAEPTCAFSFVDISGTGASVVVGDDVSSGAIPLGGAGSFNFYGVDYTQLVMASNGYISTDPTDTGPDLSNDCPLPAAPSTGGGARIYPLHDDLDLEAGFGEGFYEYLEPCPRPSDRFPAAQLGCHVFMWDSVAHFPGGGAATVWDMQALLYDRSWEIVFQHGAGNPETGSGSTTGIQNAAPDDALNYACDTGGSVADSTAQCFVHPFPDPSLLAPVIIPALDWRGLLALMALLALAGVVMVRRQTQ